MDMIIGYPHLPRPFDIPKQNSTEAALRRWLDMLEESMHEENYFSVFLSIS